MSEREGEVRVIRRYANRKLYDTTERAFTTLAAVEERIRNGEEVQVVDHVTGEDLTDQTLARLVGEVVQASSSGLNLLLSSLIRASGDLARSVTENVADNIARSTDPSAAGDAGDPGDAVPRSRRRPTKAAAAAAPADELAVLRARVDALDAKLDQVLTVFESLLARLGGPEG